MKRSVFLLLILFFGIASNATDWYVRPAGGTYGDENGTSYDNAWDGLMSVDWGEGGVTAGDTLYVCGLHIWEEVPSPSALSYWTIGASGTDENTRITIRGDHPDDQGIIWGVDIQAGDSRVWSSEGSGVWSTTTGNYNDFFFEDVTATSWTILDKITTTTGTLTGTWTFTNGSTTVNADGDGNAQTELDDGDIVYISTGTAGNGYN